MKKKLKGEYNSSNVFRLNHRTIDNRIYQCKQCLEKYERIEDAGCCCQGEEASDDRIPKTVGISICLDCGFKTNYDVAPDECNDCDSDNLVTKQYVLNETDEE